MTKAKALEFCRSGIINKEQIHNLLPALVVTYGNNEKANVSTYVDPNVLHQENIRTIYVFVTVDSNHSMILGRTTSTLSDLSA